MSHTTLRRLGFGVALLLLTALVAGCGSSGSGDQTTAGTADATTAASAGPFAAGDTVAAKWIDGHLYLATVKSVDGDAVTVTYADDGTSASVAQSDVRPIPQATFAAGDRVLACYSKGKFYAGKVTEADGSSYMIAWDDGSAPSTVEAGKIITE